MKRDSVIAYVHMRHDTPLPLYASVNVMDDPPTISLVTYILIGWLIFQLKDK